MITQRTAQAVRVVTENPVEALDFEGEQRQFEKTGDHVALAEKRLAQLIGEVDLFQDDDDFVVRQPDRYGLHRHGLRRAPQGMTQDRERCIGDPSGRAIAISLVGIEQQLGPGHLFQVLAQHATVTQRLVHPRLEITSEIQVAGDVHEVVDRHHADLDDVIGRKSPLIAGTGPLIDPTGTHPVGVEQLAEAEVEAGRLPERQTVDMGQGCVGVISPLVALAGYPTAVLELHVQGMDVGLAGVQVAPGAFAQGFTQALEPVLLKGAAELAILGFDSLGHFAEVAKRAGIGQPLDLVQGPHRRGGNGQQMIAYVLESPTLA